MQEKPLLTNAQIIALRDVCNELCVAINTYQMCCHPNNQSDLSWDHLMSRNIDANDMLVQLSF